MIIIHSGYPSPDNIAEYQNTHTYGYTHTRHIKYSTFPFEKDQERGLPRSRYITAHKRRSPPLPCIAGKHPPVPAARCGACFYSVHYHKHLLRLSERHQLTAHFYPCQAAKVSMMSRRPCHVLVTRPPLEEIDTISIRLLILRRTYVHVYNGKISFFTMLKTARVTGFRTVKSNRGIYLLVRGPIGCK